MGEFYVRSQVRCTLTAQAEDQQVCGTDHMWGEELPGGGGLLLRGVSSKYNSAHPTIHGGLDFCMLTAAARMLQSLFVPKLLSQFEK